MTCRTVPTDGHKSAALALKLVEECAKAQRGDPSLNETDIRSALVNALVSFDVATHSEHGGVH